jgi:hypothetical protein
MNAPEPCYTNRDVTKCATATPGTPGAVSLELPR